HEFTKAFIKDRKMIGAVRPSSRFLVKKMLANVDFEKARIIVELGPGTGVFTKKIVEKMHPECRLLIFELNDGFYKRLKEDISDPRCIFIHDSAEFIDKYLKEHHLGKADFILSSLPLANFPARLRKRLVIASSQNINQNGKFIQFQYSTQSKVLFESVFEKVQIKFTLWNFPPAFVFTCGH
ncbi:MAG: phospholipid methyltransferase, partial [Bacteroidetes bacterium]|nr:phospholipid methyltransferase [Bacteroidota bacterium]